MPAPSSSEGLDTQSPGLWIACDVFFDLHLWSSTWPYRGLRFHGGALGGKQQGWAKATPVAVTN